MNRQILVNKKRLQKISRIISEKLDLSNVKEFEELEMRKLFQEPPEGWNELEHTICEYQARVSEEIFGAVKNQLLNGNAR